MRSVNRVKVNSLLSAIFILFFATSNSAFAVCPNGGGGPGNAWTSRHSDDMLLSKLFIPGTHDSAAYDTPGDVGETQDWNIATQLNNGIRFLDIRISNSSYRPYPFELRHGSLQLGNFQTLVLDPVNQYLNANPCETILMSVSNEGGPLNTNAFVQQVINAPGSKFYTSATPNTVLAVVRGKIVFFDRMSAGVGIQWSSLYVQDHYDLQNNCSWLWYPPFYDCSIDYPAKASKVIEFLNMASNNAQAPPNFWINFASAQWNGMYVGNNASVANTAVDRYCGLLQLSSMFSPNNIFPRYGNVILMDYPNRNGSVIGAMINVNAIGCSPGADGQWLCRR